MDRGGTVSDFHFILLEILAFPQDLQQSGQQKGCSRTAPRFGGLIHYFLSYPYSSALCVESGWTMHFYMVNGHAAREDRVVGAAVGVNRSKR